MFAYEYDLKEVNAFSSGYDVNIAAGVRMFRMASNVNNQDGVGLIYPITGDFTSYVMTPNSQNNNIWPIFL